MLGTLVMLIARHGTFTLGELRNTVGANWTAVAIATLSASVILVFVGIGLTVYLIARAPRRQAILNPSDSVQKNAEMRTNMPHAHPNTRRFSFVSVSVMAVVGCVGCVTLAAGELNADWRMGLLGLALIVTTLALALGLAFWRR